jgi:hypothetical protein
MSVVVPTAFSSGFQKLGQPVPLSNFVADEKTSRSQPAQANAPRRFFMIERAGERSFGRRLSQHGVLRRGEQPAPFGIGMRHLELLGRDEVDSQQGSAEHRCDTTRAQQQHPSSCEHRVSPINTLHATSRDSVESRCI